MCYPRGWQPRWRDGRCGEWIDGGEEPGTAWLAVDVLIEMRPRAGSVPKIRCCQHPYGVVVVLRAVAERRCLLGQCCTLRELRLMKQECAYALGGLQIGVPRLDGQDARVVGGVGGADDSRGFSWGCRVDLHTGWQTVEMPVGRVYVESSIAPPSAKPLTRIKRRCAAKLASYSARPRAFDDASNGPIKRASAAECGREQKCCGILQHHLG